MSRQAYDIDAGHLSFETARAHLNGAFDTQEEIESELRCPGPLPSLEAIRPVAQPDSEPVALDVIVASSLKSAPTVNQNVLEGLSLRLQTVFTLLLLVSLPFIAYVLSWRSGFDLTIVTYPLLATVLGGSAVVVWAVSRRSGSRAFITDFAGWARILSWTPLQVIPIAGFALWRGGGFGRLEALIPLLAITWAFVAVVGIPKVQSELVATGEPSQ